MGGSLFFQVALSVFLPWAVTGWLYRTATVQRQRDVPMLDRGSVVSLLDWAGRRIRLEWWIALYPFTPSVVSRLRRPGPQNASEAHQLRDVIRGIFVLRAITCVLLVAAFTFASLATFGPSRLLGLFDAAVFNLAVQAIVAIYGCSLYRKCALAQAAVDALAAADAMP